MGAPSAKPLFQAMRGKPKGKQPAQDLLGDFPELEKGEPRSDRDPLDYDPTPPDATAAFLGAELGHIQKHGVQAWETAVGAGHIAYVLQRYGFSVIGSDVVDRGWPGVELKSFYDYDTAQAPINITNPPYGEISAGNGHGRWLKHCFALGLPYVAMLLNADWAFARKNGFDRLFDEHPPSVEYLCCWKIDFRGLGAPPQRNSWFVWDVNRPAMGPGAWRRERLYRERDGLQVGFDFGAGDDQTVISEVDKATGEIRSVSAVKGGGAT